MFTNQRELETHRASHTVYREAAIGRAKSRSTDVVLVGITIDIDRGAAQGIIRVRAHVFLPANLRTAIITEEVLFVGGEMFQTKLVVRHGELSRVEFLLIFSARSLAKMPTTPAGIDQFPLASVDPYCIPGVPGFKRRNSASSSKLFMTVSLSMTGDHDGFQPGLGSQGGEEPGESLTYC